MRTSSSSVWRSRRDTDCAKSAQCPGGNSEFGPSAKYSAVTFCSSVNPALIAMRASAWLRYSGDG